MAKMDRGTFEKFQKSIDPRWIDAALEATGTATMRRRRLPAEQVVWLVLGMALFRNLSIRDVVKSLDLALPGSRGRTVAESSIVEARTRLGDKPLKWLFERCAREWAQASADRHRWRGLAVYGVDGTTVRVPDSAANRAHFGVHGSRRGESAYPLARLVTLMVLRSHLLLAGRFGPIRISEQALAKELWSQVPEHSLCLVDRGFFGAALLLKLQEGHRHWLTRQRANARSVVLKTFAEGDELWEMAVSKEARALDPSLPKTWQMRAILYQRKGFRPQRLLTSLVDPEKYPAEELVALYHERWELELGYNEIKTRMLEREESIRSRKVAGVEQEIWGLALAYNLVRLEIERVADEAHVAPARISFVASLRYIRQALQIASFVSPGMLPKHLRHMREDLQEFVLPPRRSDRAYPRAVKIKMSNYSRKRRAAHGSRP